MAKKKKKARKKAKSWDSIGKDIGTKIEKECKDKKTVCKPWAINHKDHGGFVGRALFAVGVACALSTTGLLNGVPPWTVVFMAIGFALMKF